LLSALLLAIGFPLGELAGIGVRGLIESATYATGGAIVASRRSENPIWRWQLYSARRESAFKA
jgi:hypothetical protein